MHILDGCSLFKPEKMANWANKSLLAALTKEMRNAVEVLSVHNMESHCGTVPSQLAGMHGYLTVRDCGDKEVKKSQLSYKERRMVKHWEYFIAAEEITWDYAPNIQDSLDR